MQLGRVITKDNEVLIFLDGTLIYAYQEFYDIAMTMSKEATFTQFQDGFGIFENNKDVVNFAVFDGINKDFEFNRFSYEYDSLDTIAKELKGRIEEIRKWSFATHKKVEIIDFEPNDFISDSITIVDNSSKDDPDNVLVIGDKYKDKLNIIYTIIDITDTIVSVFWIGKNVKFTTDVNKVDFIDNINTKKLTKIAYKRKYLCTSCNKHYVKKAMLNEGDGIKPTICLNCYASGR